MLPISESGKKFFNFPYLISVKKFDLSLSFCYFGVKRRKSKKIFVVKFIKVRLKEIPTLPTYNTFRTYD